MELYMLHACGCASRGSQESKSDDLGAENQKIIESGAKVVKIDAQESRRNFAVAYSPLESELISDERELQFSHPLASTVRVIFNFLGICPENAPSALEKTDLLEYFSGVDQAFYGKVQECQKVLAMLNYLPCDEI